MYYLRTYQVLMKIVVTLFFLFGATSASWVQTIRHSVINYFLINALSGNANQTINIEIKIINYSQSRICLTYYANDFFTEIDQDQSYRIETHATIHNYCSGKHCSLGHANICIVAILIHLFQEGQSRGKVGIVLQQSSYLLVINHVLKIAYLVATDRICHFSINNTGSKLQTLITIDTRWHLIILVP